MGVRREALEASLHEVLFQIIKFVNEKKDHVPPINEDIICFPCEITIPRLVLILPVHVIQNNIFIKKLLIMCVSKLQHVACLSFQNSLPFCSLNLFFPFNPSFFCSSFVVDDFFQHLLTLYLYSCILIPESSFYEVVLPLICFMRSFLSSNRTDKAIIILKETFQHSHFLDEMRKLNVEAVRVNNHTS